MKFTWFNLMPWPYLPDDFREKHRSVWVDIDSRLFDAEKSHEVYNTYMDLLEYAGTLGFDGIGVNEHHQNAYGIMPSPVVTASALSRRVKTAKIAILGNAFCLRDNPLTLAEEHAMIDCITGGRLITGFVRGVGAEYFSMGTNPVWSLERHQEAHDLVVQAWTRPGPFAFAEETALSRHWLWSTAHVVPYETTSEQSGYFSIVEGKNKKIYVGTAKYSENAFLVEFDPATKKMYVVLDAQKTKAVVGLKPQKQADGTLVVQREAVEVGFDEIKWAKALPKKTDPKAVSDVLVQGDVIYISPKDPADPAGVWSLMQIPEIGGGLVAMDPHTGRVLAVAGGFSFAMSQFDRAIQAKRQPGSSFKPFVYAAAIDNGYKPTSIILDAPIEIEQGPGLEIWKPDNYDNQKSAGPSTLRFGIEKSRNQMTVRLAQDLGMPMITEYARRFGIYDDLLPVLSMSLGAGETTLIKMATAYSMLANGGRQVKATLIDRIQDRWGKTVWRHDERQCMGCMAEKWGNQAEPDLIDDRKQIIDPHTAYQMTSILEGVVQRGTATSLKALNRPLAGKTGTTNEEKDVWFVGYTPDMVVGVFVGYDTPKPMGKGNTGGAIAAPIFGDFLKAALADKPAAPFRIPPGLKLVRVNLKSGLRAAAGEGDAIMEAFKPNEEPDDAYSVIGVAGTAGATAATASSGDAYQPGPGAPPPPPGAGTPGIGSGRGGVW